MKAIKNSKMVFRLTEKEREIINLNAKKLGWSDSQYVRYASINTNLNI